MRCRATPRTPRRCSTPSIPSMQTNPVYYFSRAQRARQFELWDDARRPGSTRPRATCRTPRSWWYERQTLVRQLLAVGDAKRAYRRRRDYTDGPEGRLVEARFHAGWIALSSSMTPRRPMPHFEGMAKLSTLPDSVTQANYWLGRARLQLGRHRRRPAPPSMPLPRYGTRLLRPAGARRTRPSGAELRDMPDWAGGRAGIRCSGLLCAPCALLARTMARPTLAAAAAAHSRRWPHRRRRTCCWRRGWRRKSAPITSPSSIADTADEARHAARPLQLPQGRAADNGKLAEIDQAAVYAVARQESRFQADAIHRAPGPAG